MSLTSARNSVEYVRELLLFRDDLRENRGPEGMSFLRHGGVPPEEVVRVLKARCWNEMQTLEIVAYWASITPETEIKLLMARQAHDEARHYELLASRIRELGAHPEDFAPSPERRALFSVARCMPSTIERVAYLNLNEARGLEDDDLIARRMGDRELAAMYESIIGPDERLHEQIGIKALQLLCDTPEKQEKARRALELSNYWMVKAVEAFREGRE